MRKLLRNIIVMSMCAVLFICCSGNVFADDSETYYNVWDDMQYEEMNMADYTEANERLKLRRLDQLPDRQLFDRLIESYDVSRDGKIAIAYAHERIIAVYDKDFTFEYAISFWLNGTYGVLWYGENIALMNGRGDCATVINENAEPIAEFRIKGISDSNKDYWNQIVKNRTRVWGDYTYFCYDRLGSERIMEISSTAGGCHVLQRVDAEGNVEVLYEEEQKAWKEILSAIFPIMPFAAVIGIVFYSKKKAREKELARERVTNDAGAPQY